jgi:hypothetical protein
MVNGFHIGIKNLNYRGLGVTWTAAHAAVHYITSLYSLRADTYSPTPVTRVCGYQLMENLKPTF